MQVKLSLLEMIGKANDWTYHSDEDQFTDVNADLQAIAEMGKTYEKWETYCHQPKNKPSISSENTRVKNEIN